MTRSVNVLVLVHIAELHLAVLFPFPTYRPTLISRRITSRHSILGILRQRYHVYVHGVRSYSYVDPIIQGYTSTVILVRTMDLSKPDRQKLSKVTVLLIVSQRTNNTHYK